MIITSGNLYFISDDFFQKVNDPYLKINYEDTKRPHYFAFEDTTTNLFWVAPCSSKVEKYEKIIEQKKKQHKPNDTIKIVTIQNNKSAILFQDMFPTTEKYIEEQYFRGNQPVQIADPKIIDSLEKSAKKVINLIHRGIKFTPTQPNVHLIETLMLEELNQSKAQNTKTMQERIEAILSTLPDENSQGRKR